MIVSLKKYTINEMKNLVLESVMKRPDEQNNLLMILFHIEEFGQNYVYSKF